MPQFNTLISTEELAEQIDHCIVVDCRHDLANPQAGRQAYAQGHIPGAHFLHLDDDLSATMTGSNGRHPLPDADALASTLSAIGLQPGRQLVAYDGASGMVAARLWWMARWLGHDAVAVLDGGLPAWLEAGFPQSTEVSPPAATVPPASWARPEQLKRLDASAMLANIGKPEYLVIDARAAERFRGETEPMDAKAGHIPGAVNRPFTSNLRDKGRFKPAPVLREEFTALIGEHPPGAVVHSCGSGVTACHNLLAMAHAGLDGASLYPGSWSEWSSDDSRPVATGE